MYSDCKCLKQCFGINSACFPMSPAVTDVKMDVVTEAVVVQVAVRVVALRVLLRDAQPLLLAEETCRAGEKTARHVGALS